MGTSSLRLFRYGQAPRRAVLATAAWLAAGLLLAAPALADTGGTAPPEPSAEAYCFPSHWLLKALTSG